LEQRTLAGAVTRPGGVATASSIGSRLRSPDGHRLGSGAEVVRFEFPEVVQRKAGRDIARISQGDRAGVQPRDHIGSVAPGLQCFEADPPDQRPIRVVHERAADAVYRRGPIPVEFVEIDCELLNRQRRYVAWCRRKGRMLHVRVPGQLTRPGGSSGVEIV